MGFVSPLLVVGGVFQRELWFACFDFRHFPFKRVDNVGFVISRIPTPLGNLVPISQVRDDVAATYSREVEWQTAEKLLPYQKMCTQRKVQVELVQIESDDMVTAISEDILKYKINSLVINWVFIS